MEYKGRVVPSGRGEFWRDHHGRWVPTQMLTRINSSAMTTHDLWVPRIHILPPCLPRPTLSLQDLLYPRLALNLIQFLNPGPQACQVNTLAAEPHRQAQRRLSSKLPSDSRGPKVAGVFFRTKMPVNSFVTRIKKDLTIICACTTCTKYHVREVTVNLSHLCNWTIDQLKFIC